MASTVPAAVSAMLPELLMSVVHSAPSVPENQSIVTLPVGLGWPPTPVTVTESWTVDPAATAVTTWCAALWISVAVDDGNCVISDCEAAPFGGGFGKQFVVEVPLHRSCQPRLASSLSTW